MKPLLVRIVQLTIILIPVGIFVWLLNQELVPSGTFVIAHGVNELSPFIDRILPDDRALAPAMDADGDWVQAIVGDPGYFFVHPHRSFDAVHAEVWFKNEGVPIVELGALSSPTGESYDLRPLQNLLIDDSSWDRMSDNGIVLLQRTHTYDSVNAFLQNPPPLGEIATYHETLAQPFRLAGYVPSSATQMVDVSLRGFHEFETYIKDETLRFDVAYMDMNRKNGAEPVRVTVYDATGNPVAEARAADDGDVSEDAKPSALSTLTVEAAHLPEGVYKVELNAERDIFFRTITTTQQKITFLNNVYLGDEVGYRAVNRAVKFWTEAKNMRFVTQHADALQEVSVGGNVVRVTEPYQEARAEVTQPGVIETDVPHGDLIVNTDGHIAFSPAQYFDPDPVRLSADTNLDRLGVNYVIAHYTPPRQEGNWLVASVDFDTSIMAEQSGAWKFVISTPDIDEHQKRLLVGRINLTLTRPPFTWTDLVEAVKKRL